MSLRRYVELLKAEIRQRAADVPIRELDTIYFGGGTPSLLDPSDIVTILDELSKEGFRLKPDAEITIEIDPKTADGARLDAYLSLGINRFSVGAQSFNDRLLKVAGRRHTSRDVVELLTLLKERHTNYSFDLLFALPSQTLHEVGEDVAQALEFAPSHVSAYCLTVPEGHKLSYHRAPEDEQIEMFARIETDLARGGLERYEISNFAKLGFESKHNSLYWTDQPYWGIGLSSHSYFPRGFSKSVDSIADWGARFWNVRAIKRYNDLFASQLGADGTLPAESSAPHTWTFATGFADATEDDIEKLALHQALSDYCHTTLRLRSGLDENALRLKFGDRISELVRLRLQAMQQENLLLKTELGWALSSEGKLVANLVFEKLTFLASEVV